MCDEPADWRTFRLGLFGLDKWANADRAVSQITAALERMGVK
jgi:aspartate aminotransferase-like enzyme